MIDGQLADAAELHLFFKTFADRADATKYLNRYVLIGKGREVDPAWGKYDDFIDKHLFYHRKMSRAISAGTVLSFAFTIKTRGPGLYPMHVEFLSDEVVGEETRLFVTVEPTPTIKLRCKHTDV